MHEKKGPNGFLLGLILGGAVGALVSTKRGRQILKDIADYGLDYVGKSINLDDIESMLDEDEEILQGEMNAEDKVKENHTQDANKDEKNETISRRRRLFKGIGRKS